MVKIKVKLRPSSIEGRAGTIYYHLSHRRVVRHITTGIRISPRMWDDENQRIIDPESDENGIQNRIDSDIDTLHGIVRELESHRRPFGVTEIVARFRDPERNVSVLGFLDEQIAFLTECNRLGTAANYRRAAETLRGFLAGRDINFTEITQQFVERYGDYLLLRGMVRNSVSFHMRILRAVYNKAVRHGLAEQSFPFRSVYTGIDRTRKRAVNESTVACLYRLDLSSRPRMALARDLFLFSYFTRGMAFVDIAYLRKSDIADGMIRYTRRKTGQQLSIRIEPCMRTIIERYMSDNSQYVFPILKSDDAGRAYSQYRTAINSHNHMLRQLSKMLPECCSLTSYTSRHSWATAARNHNIPISVISAGLGHTSERTTQIYLTALENSVIDAANSGILSAIGV